MRAKLRSLFGAFSFRLFLIVALCWLLPTVVLGTYLGSVFFNALHEKMESSLVVQAQHAQAGVVQEIERAITLSKDATYDGELWSLSSAYRAGYYKYQDFYKYCRIYLERKYSREPLFNFQAFYLLDDPAVPFMFTGAEMDQLISFKQHAEKAVMDVGMTLDTKCRFVSRGGHTYLVRNLYNKKLERFGMLVLGIDPQRLFATLLDKGELWAGKVDIMLDEHIALTKGADPLTGDSLRLGLYEQDDNMYYCGQVLTRDYQLTYRAMLDKLTIYAQIDQFYLLMRIVLLMLIPIEGAIAIFVHRKLTKPLRALAEASRRIERGELGFTVTPTGGDEIGQLGKAYNAMSLRIQHLIEKSFQEEFALRDARIEALQSRVNPHFLNNALEMINWQARMEGSETISGMVDALSTLLNAGLDRSNRRTVPLRDELTVADAYFYFLDQRFGSRLTVYRDIDEALLSETAPRLVVQTLLENAVEHGIAPAGGGWIRVRIYAADGNLHIDVTNNGKRLTPEDTARIAQLLIDDGEIRSERLGIRNINRRLKLIYGQKAGLTLVADENCDTLARIVIPLAENHSLDQLN